VSASKSNTGRPVLTIAFKPEPGVENPTLAIRALLKTALRRFGLRALSVEETPK
jgi:hypothetical protein